MLPAAHRLRSSASFRHAARRGDRAGSRTLVVHLDAAGDGDPEAAAVPVGSAPVRIGLVVSRAVGSAVVRNRVKRRLRHLLRDRLAERWGDLPGSTVVVVRATPSAAGASSQELAADLDRCLDRLTSVDQVGDSRRQGTDPR